MTYVLSLFFSDHGLTKKLGFAQAISGRHRCAMIELYLKHKPWMVDKWLAYQDTNPGISYASTLLKEEVLNVRKSVEFGLVCGPDLLAKLNRGFREQSLIICVLNRKPEFDVEEFVNYQKKNVGARIELVKLPYEEFSSTAVRKCFMNKDLEILEKMVHKDVIEYHKKHNLVYTEDLAKKDNDNNSNNDRDNNNNNNNNNNEDAAAAVLSESALNWLEFARSCAYNSGLLEEWKCFDIDPKSKQGSGVSGSVFFATDLRNDKQVAIKMITLDDGKARILKVKAKGIENEIDCARRLQYCDRRHVCFAMNVIVSDVGIGLVLEPYHISCWSFIQKFPHLVDGEFAFKVLMDVACGMAQIHRAKIVHRDLHSRNVLLLMDKDKVGKAAVADFGVALNTSARGKEKMISELRGSMLHYGPEAVKEKSAYCFASDVFMWSYLAVVLLTKREVWDGDKEHGIADTLNGKRPALPRFFCNDLIEQAWHQNFQRRPTFDELAEEMISRSKKKGSLK